MLNLTMQTIFRVIVKSAILHFPAIITPLLLSMQQDAIASSSVQCNLALFHLHDAGDHPNGVGVSAAAPAHSRIQVGVSDHRCYISITH
jgi:hypothetical protein